MEKIYKCMIIIAVISSFMFFNKVAFAADDQYRFTHNDHDTLIIGEITFIDTEKMIVLVEDYIVSRNDMSLNDKKKQLRPQNVTIRNDSANFFENKKVGDYVIASLDKNGDMFDNAWGIFNVSSLDYKTLKVAAFDPSNSAALTDFVNSGGIYTEFAFSYGTVIRLYDGTETVIYQNERVSEQSAISNITQSQAEKQETKTHTDYKSYMIYVLGAIVVLCGIVLAMIKNRK